MICRGETLTWLEHAENPDAGSFHIRLASFPSECRDFRS